MIKLHKPPSNEKSVEQKILFSKISSLLWQLGTNTLWCQQLRLAHQPRFPCFCFTRWISAINKKHVYTSSHNHGSVKNGCISSSSYLSNIAVFHFHDYGRKSSRSRMVSFIRGVFFFNSRPCPTVVTVKCGAVVSKHRLLLQPFGGSQLSHHLKRLQVLKPEMGFFSSDFFGGRAICWGILSFFFGGGGGVVKKAAHFLGKSSFPRFRKNASWVKFRFRTSNCDFNGREKNPLCWVVPPPRMSVTTSIITFLVGDPYKPLLATGILGGGGQPNLYVCFRFTLEIDPSSLPKTSKTNHSKCRIRNIFFDGKGDFTPIRAEIKTPISFYEGARINFAMWRRRQPPSIEQKNDHHKKK